MVKMMQDADLEHITVHTRAMNLSLQQLKNSVDANDIITDPDFSVSMFMTINGRHV